MSILKELTEGDYAKKTVKIPVLKPRNPNQEVLANKKNAGGPMKDKKRAILNGEPKHKKDVYEGDIPKTGDRVEYDNYDMWKHELPKSTHFRSEGDVEFAQSIGRTLEGISGKWNSRTKTGWIYEYYLNPKNLYEAKKHIYGPGDEELKNHPSKVMQQLYKGPIKATMTSGDEVMIVKVEWFNGGSNFITDEFGKVSEMDVLEPIGRAKPVTYKYKSHKPVREGKWNDSGASDAEGRWSKYAKGDLGVGAMATWLYNSRVHKKTKAEKLKSAYGAIAQQENTSKLISAAKADALRAELKKKQGVNESEYSADQMRDARNAAEAGRGPSAKDFKHAKTEYVYRITFEQGYSTDWKTAHLYYATVEDMAEEFKHPYEGDQGWVTDLVEPVLGITHAEHSFYAEDYILESVKDDMLKVTIEYTIHHKNYDPNVGHSALLTIQAVA